MKVITLSLIELGVKLLHNQRDGYSKTVALYNNEKHIIGARKYCGQSQCHKSLFDRVLKAGESRDVHSENACHEVPVASSICSILEASLSFLRGKKGTQ